MIYREAESIDIIGLYSVTKSTNEIKLAYMNIAFACTYCAIKHVQDGTENRFRKVDNDYIYLAQQVATGRPTLLCSAFKSIICHIYPILLVKYRMQNFVLYSNVNSRACVIL